MKGTTKLEPRRNFHAGLLPLLLLAGGVAVNCSSGTTDNSKTITPGGGSANTAAGTSSGGSGNNTAAGASSGGTSAGGSGGAATGKPPMADGTCGNNTTKRDGLCYCQPSSYTYCSDGCSDLKDADHCGSCTNKCGDTQGCGGGGKCGATPATLVPAAAGCGTIRLAISGTTLYWTEETTNKVKSMTLPSGTPKEIGMPGTAPKVIVANGTNAFWIADGDKTIRKSAAGADATVFVPTVTGTITGFTVAADGALYYAVNPPAPTAPAVAHPTIYKVPAAGGTAVEVGHEDSGIPHALAVEGSLLGYPTELNGDVDVMTLVDGTPAVCASMDSTTAVNKNCIRLSQSQMPNYEGMYIIGGIAYWSNQAAIQAKSATMADASSKTIGSADGALAMRAFSISNGTAFFAGDDDTGFVFTAPITGTASQTAIARKQKAVTSVVADASKAYWATECTIMSVGLAGASVSPI